ncbi:hypothetical protein [Clostridium perfringens]|uniref:hypothetical protein n=1 Tax=Clostridium perfringens TaxID=1502 RepID=UPI0020934B85|nr:hypothetical protein [Clostridium perfringens]
MSFVKTIPLTSTLSTLYPSAGFTFIFTSSPVLINTSPPVRVSPFISNVPFPSVLTFSIV